MTTEPEELKEIDHDAEIEIYEDTQGDDSWMTEVEKKLSSGKRLSKIDTALCELGDDFGMMPWNI